MSACMAQAEAQGSRMEGGGSADAQARPVAVTAHEDFDTCIEHALTLMAKEVRWPGIMHTPTHTHTHNMDHFVLFPGRMHACMLASRRSLI
jgi:hypothetical protein